MYLCKNHFSLKKRFLELCWKKNMLLLIFLLPIRGMFPNSGKEQLNKIIWKIYKNKKHDKFQTSSQ